MNLGIKLFRTLQKHSISRNYAKLPSELVVFMDDNMVVCWHPEQPFPYEFTKPLPEKIPEPESVLKIGDKEVKAIFTKPKQDLIPEELARITNTCKYRWYPRSDKKRRPIPPDRPYL